MSDTQDSPRYYPSQRPREDGYTAIYALVDPRTGVVRYVGKTRWPLSHRLRGHMVDATRNGHTHKAHWLNALRREGLKPRIVTLELVPADQWEAAERHWIARFPDLTNSTKGGEIGGWGWQRGEKVPGARLTETQVVTISERFAAGGVTLRVLADEHGVTVKSISLIVRGINWPHVDRPLTFRKPGAKGVPRRHLAEGQMQL